MQVERIIEDQEEAGKIVAGIVVEPVQGEGGDNWASPSFFRQLQYICKKVSIFVVLFDLLVSCLMTDAVWLFSLVYLAILNQWILWYNGAQSAHSQLPLCLSHPACNLIAWYSHNK